VLQELFAERVRVRSARVVHVRRRADIPQHRGRRGRRGRHGRGRRSRRQSGPRGRPIALPTAEPDGRLDGRGGRWRREPRPDGGDHMGDHGQLEHTVPGELDPVGIAGAEPVPRRPNTPPHAADGNPIGRGQLSRRCRWRLHRRPRR